MPPLQSVGQFAPDRRVKRLQAGLEQRQPGVDPGVNRDGVGQRVPVIHLFQQGRSSLLISVF